MRPWQLCLPVFALLPIGAMAYPDGAPWDVLDSHPEVGCVSCHMGGGPVEDSAALMVEGGEEGFAAGETRRLKVVFTPEEAGVMGFLATFRRGETPAGLVPAVCEGGQPRGATIRARALEPDEEGSAVWCFDWTAPDTPGAVTVNVGAVAANDDASPFGDEVHMKSVEFEVR